MEASVHVLTLPVGEAGYCSVADDPDQRLTASQATVHPFFDASQQLIRSADASGQPVVCCADSSKQQLGATQWERCGLDLGGQSRDGWHSFAHPCRRRLKRLFDDLAVDGGELKHLETQVLRQAQLAAAETGGSEEVRRAPLLSPCWVNRFLLWQSTAELARCVAAALQLELSASLKQRSDAARTMQKRLLLEAQQLQLPLPSSTLLPCIADAEKAHEAERAKLEHELHELKARHKQTMERARAEKEETLAKIVAVQQDIAVACEAAPKARENTGIVSPQESQSVPQAGEL